MMDTTERTTGEIRDKLTRMAATTQYQETRTEFTEVTGGLVARARKNADAAWEDVTAKIITFLPGYITNGLVQCTLETVPELDACQQAMASHKKKLVIKPGNQFPKLSFPAFYPYIEFLLMAGPYEVMKWKKSFKVEGSVYVKEATIMFDGNKMTGISGIITASVILSLCRGTTPWKLYEFDQSIHLE
jgi:hypothetical protein